ncbi:MAG: methionyl-tRNA formyltransferase [Solobacterium sp.]|nr:methionyl-tRNA formyltransferase [Solobacterium sp.]
MENIRVLFIGTPEFACPILQTLYDEKYNLVAVVSQPDKPVGRKHIIEKTPIHALADELGIPVVQPNKLKEEYASVLAYEPDLIITCAYGQMIPEEVLQYPKYGCLNIHPSLLPKYRGGAPVHRAVWAGDKETGVCLMEMVKAMDAGKVYAKTIVPIAPNDTTSSLNVKLEAVASQLLKEQLPLYLKGELPGVEQDEEGVVIARNISKEEEQVHFSLESAQEAYNHIRALLDWPVAYGMIEGKRIKFYESHLVLEENTFEPGFVVGLEEESLKIALRGGYLYVDVLQPEGKQKMAAKDFMNGAGRNLVGKVFA